MKKLVFHPRFIVPAILLAVLLLWRLQVVPPSGPEAPDRKSALRSIERQIEDPLEKVFGTLSQQANTSERRNTLLQLRRDLQALPVAGAVSAITAMLATGQDHDLGLPLQIGPDGALQAWPTWRAFLLDTLFLIDTGAAAAMSREILSNPTTADEWAIALRNVARVGEEPANAEWLRTKTEELIRNPAWQDAPSIGYLNAFDVLVHTRAVESAPLLSGLVQNKERKDLAHAAFLTLDRLVQSEPTAMLEKLANDTALQQSRPEMTAQQFARADLRDPAQRAIVESWLINPNRSPVELRAFAGVFPNHNQFVSNNLLTRSQPPSGSDLAAHDREVMEIIRAWEADPRFKPVQNHLRTMIQRLEQFTTPLSP